MLAMSKLISRRQFTRDALAYFAVLSAPLAAPVALLEADEGAAWESVVLGDSGYVLVDGWLLTAKDLGT